MTHTYTVIHYDLRRGIERQEVTVDAATAEEAIAVVAGLGGRGFRFTRKNQKAPDPADRDNAHYQADPSRGYIGWAACRAGREEQYRS